MDFPCEARERVALQALFARCPCFECDVGQLLRDTSFKGVIGAVHKSMPSSGLVNLECCLSALAKGLHFDASLCFAMRGALSLLYS